MQVKHLLVEGREVVRDGRIATFDLEKTIGMQNLMARNLADRI